MNPIVKEAAIEAIHNVDLESVKSNVVAFGRPMVLPNTSLSRMEKAVRTHPAGLNHNGGIFELNPLHLVPGS